MMLVNTKGAILRWNSHNPCFTDIPIPFNQQLLKYFLLSFTQILSLTRISIQIKQLPLPRSIGFRNKRSLPFPLPNRHASKEFPAGHVVFSVYLRTLALEEGNP